MTELQRHYSALNRKQRKAFITACVTQKLTEKEVNQAITKSDATLRGRYVLSMATGIDINSLFQPIQIKQLQLFKHENRNL